MRLNLQKILEKSFIFRVLILLCLVFSCVDIINRKKRNNCTISEHRDQATRSAIPQNKTVLPILLMACESQFFTRSIHSLTTFRPNQDRFPIIVALYCYPKANYDILQSVDWDPSITVIEIPKSVDDGWLADGRHYKIAFNYVFRLLKHEAVVVLEDNLDISPDFFEYFLAAYPLLKKDPSIWCVSAWNDNCKPDLVEANQYFALHRTHFFPGMGWMLLSETWDDIELRLRKGFFEDSLYNPIIILGRVCIRPEISRTYKFGAYDLNNRTKLPHGHLLNVSRLLLNTVYVPFTQLNLSYVLKDHERLFVTFVYSCPVTTVDDVKTQNINGSSEFVRIPYSNTTAFKRAAKTFGFMNNFKYGEPSTGLFGIVQCFINNRRVFFSPDY